MVSEKGHLEWKKMYFKLSRCYPHREQYSDTLHFCTHCHILFWKVVLLFMLLTRSKNQHGTEILSQVKTEIKKTNIDCLMSVSFCRTQTIRAQPTTPKVAPCRSPLKTLLTFLTSDTLPPPTKRRMNWLYILYIQMYITDLCQGTIISWICI